jgi:hypothetical protein
LGIIDTYHARLILIVFTWKGIVTAGKYFLITTVILAVSLLAGCAYTYASQSQSVSTNKASVSATALPTKNSPTNTTTPKPTATIIPTPKPTLTPTKEGMDSPRVEWSNVTLHINGHQVEFATGKEGNIDPFGKWGIEGFKPKTDLNNFDSHFSEMVSASLWEVYCAENKNKEITYEAFMKNLDQYKIVSSQPGVNGNFVNVQFSLNDLKRVEMRYVASEDDPRLTFNDPTITSKPEGTAFHDGVLVLYRGAPVEEKTLDNIAEPTFVANFQNTAPLMIGNWLGSMFFTDIIPMAYSGQLGYPTGNGKDYLPRMRKIKEMIGYPTTEAMAAAEGSDGISPEFQGKYLPIHGFWIAIMK